MAKKKTIKKRAKSRERAFDDKMLPQNILLLGERVEENKNIYILQKIYKEIHKFTQNKTTNESGGMLIGYVIEEFGKINIVINGFIEAKHCEATPTTLKFTHETWEFVHKEMDRKFPGEKIVGWIHTHPDFGIFLSEYDKFIHENFFDEDYQVAYVVDPIQSIEGFYFWISGKIERCRGFYVYDKTGEKINVSNEQEDNIETRTNKGTFGLVKALLAVLVILVFFLFFSVWSQNSEIKKLQQEQETLVTSANQSISYMQQQINFLSSELTILQQSFEEAKTDNSTEDIDTSATNDTLDANDVVESENGEGENTNE